MILGRQIAAAILMDKNGEEWVYRDHAEFKILRWATPYNWMYLQYRDFEMRLNYLLKNVEECKTGEWFMNHIEQVATRYLAREHAVNTNEWLRRRLHVLKNHKGITETTRGPWRSIRNLKEHDKVERCVIWNDYLKETKDGYLMEHENSALDLLQGWHHATTGRGWDNKDFHPRFEDRSVQGPRFPTEAEAKADIAEWKRQEREKYLDVLQAQRDYEGLPEGISESEDDDSREESYRPEREEDLPRRKEDLPKGHDDLPRRKEDRPRQEEDLPQGRRPTNMSRGEGGLPRFRDDLLGRPDDLSLHGEDLPRNKEDLLRRHDGLPQFDRDLLRYQEDLLRRQDDLPRYEGGLPRHKEDLLRRQDDLPRYEGGLIRH
jgi:hypothetical protein